MVLISLLNCLEPYIGEHNEAEANTGQDILWSCPQMLSVCLMYPHVHKIGLEGRKGSGDMDPGWKAAMGIKDSLVATSLILILFPVQLRWQGS